MQCNPIKSNCLPFREITQDFSSLSDIVEHYISLRRPDIENEFHELRKISSENELLRFASLALQSNGKRNSHHYRKPLSLLSNVHKVMQNKKSQLLLLKTFDEVYDFMEKTFSRYVGIGNLYLYDTSLMICAIRNIFPQYIYLHSGTREGACLLGLPYKNKYLSENQIPIELQKLKPYEIEDVLCIYKKSLSRFRVE